ncbi:MAG: hypothetical protein EZS28_013524 [Streblomastix strix]|uniref:Uncharacterized protein n=1 Tax=Streblomastix strix TaxID=222440 RepID=A0A5J4W8I1_9EUKA|nr:MAG: hypothetical protein EZS28_013524 [Streblomastix strix]
MPQSSQSILLLTSICSTCPRSGNMFISNVCYIKGNMNILNIPLFHVTDFCLLFPKDARATICFQNLCNQNIKITTYGRNFPDMPMNTPDQQFFQLQLNASNLDLLFEATIEFEDALTTPRNTATRIFIHHTNLTSFIITLQCERNSKGALTFDGLDSQNQNTSVELRGASIYQRTIDSYFNVDSCGKIPPPPILCKVQDTFWLFAPAAGGSCTYDSSHSFDEVTGPLSSYYTTNAYYLVICCLIYKGIMNRLAEKGFRPQLLKKRPFITKKQKGKQRNFA